MSRIDKGIVVIALISAIVWLVTALAGETRNFLLAALWAGVAAIRIVRSRAGRRPIEAPRAESTDRPPSTHL